MPPMTPPMPARARRPGSVRSPTTTSGPSRPARSGRTRSDTPCCTARSTGSRLSGPGWRRDRPLLAHAETGSPQDFPKNGWVVHALQTAWWAISRADHQGDARHLATALELAVRAGGDTDTTAAIAGALLGARWGASAVPVTWRRLL